MGQWALREKPARLVLGTIAEPNSAGPLLELHGTFWDRPTLHSQPHTLWGTTRTGALITLLNAWQVGASPGFGIVETYDCASIISGVHVAAEDEFDIRYAEIDFSHLEDWATLPVSRAASPFSIDQQFDDFPHGQHFRIEFNEPVPRQLVATGKWRASLLVWSDPPNQSRVPTQVYLRQRCSLLIEFEQPAKTSEVRSVVGQWQALLAFATGKDVWLTKLISYNGRDEARSWFKAAGDALRIHARSWGGRDPEKREPIHEFDMLFHLTDLAPGQPPEIHNWFEQWEKFGPVIQHYLAGLRHQGIYEEHRFLSLVQAIEGFQRRFGQRTLITKGEYRERVTRILEGVLEDERMFVKDALRFANEPSLRTRLEITLARLIASRPYLKSQQDKLLSRVVNTRHYLSHSEPSLKKHAVTGRELFEITEILRAALELEILSFLGVTEKRASELVHRNLYRRQARSGPVTFLLEK